MTYFWYRSLVVLLVAATGPSVLDSYRVKAAGCRVASTASLQAKPSDDDLLEVLRLLPGEPQHWRFPGSVARSVSLQRSSMTDPTPTRMVVLDTEASLKSVRAFYEAAIAKSGAQRIEPPERKGRIVLAFRGGSVLLGREQNATFIVIVAEERPRPVATARPN